jgi:hypothetical protein
VINSLADDRSETTDRFFIESVFGQLILYNALAAKRKYAKVAEKSLRALPFVHKGAERLLNI